MIESSAKDLIDEIISNEFNRDNFIKFTNTLLYSASFNSVMMDRDEIPKIFQGHIDSLECLASYTDSNNKEIEKSNFWNNQNGRSIFDNLLVTI